MAYDIPGDAGGDLAADVFGLNCPRRLVAQTPPCEEAFNNVQRDRVLDISFIISRLAAHSSNSTDLLYGKIDSNNTGVVGYSIGASDVYEIAGGVPALGLASDPRVRAIMPIEIEGVGTLVTNDTLSKVKIPMRCDYIMKVKTHPPEEWPLHMHGREITVYIPMPSNRLGLRKKNVPSVKFWVDFVEHAELQLSAAKIQSRGIAIGDLQLGRYASICNEAFILKTAEMIIREDQWEGYDRRLEEINPNAKQHIYPPNEAGYNAGNHEEPGFITLINAQQHTNVL
jgi:hypothetical protein